MFLLSLLVACAPPVDDSPGNGIARVLHLPGQPWSAEPSLVGEAPGVCVLFEGDPEVSLLTGPVSLLDGDRVEEVGSWTWEGFEGDEGEGEWFEVEVDGDVVRWLACLSRDEEGALDLFDEEGAWFASLRPCG